MAVLAILLAIAATLPVAVANAKSAKRDRCARTGSVTLQVTAKVRVYRNRRDPYGAKVYACHRPTGRSTYLGSAAPSLVYQYGGARATAIRGPTIAYGAILANDSDDDLPPMYMVFVAKLPIRGFAYNHATSIRLQGDGMAIARLVLAPNGTIAYASCTALDFYPADRCARSPNTVPRIVVIPYDGSTRRYRDAIVVDTDPGIDPQSLRLSPSGTRVAWDRGGVKRAVSLAGLQRG